MTDRQEHMREQDEQRIRGLRLLDDDFLKMVFDNNHEATELLLNVFLDREDMKVLKVVSQREIKNPNGRSVRLDIYAVDSEGNHYDIEIQRQDKGAGKRRARFNSSILDTKMLLSGQDAEELADSYVIFITENDVRKQGRAIYRFERMDAETHELLNDGSHILYVNAAYRDDGSKIGRLMHDFRCVEADDMYHPVLAEKVRYFKETEGGREEMCRILEDMCNEAALYERNKIILKMLKKGFGIESIADLLEISVDEVKKVAETMDN